MNHELCRACETVKWCSANGCIPIQCDESEILLHRAMNAPSKRRSVGEIKAEIRQFVRSLESADAPVSTPQAFNWPTLAITFALVAALVAFGFGVWRVIWPLFLAAVK